MPSVPRTGHLRAIERLLRQFPVVALLGARQVGKTTLARQLVTKRHAAGHRATIFDLEDPRDLAQLADPMLALQDLTGLVVIDELHRRPDLFTVLRVLADRPRTPARFLVLGSASLDLLRPGAETLAGRIGFHRLDGLGLDEAGEGAMERLWLRGGFPRSFTAPSLSASAEWREQFVRTFLERDVPSFGLRLPATTLHRFWTMLAHWHGQVINLSELGRAFGVSDNGVRHYLDVLASTFVVRQLQPWFANISKRQVKAPKVYLADSGLLHTLLDIETNRALLGHPKVGASWEGFLLGEVVRHVGADWDQCHFWATHAGAELDLLVTDHGHQRGFAFKRTTAPAITPSMRVALADLKLTRLDVIHAGDATFRLAPRIYAVAAAHLIDDL